MPTRIPEKWLGNPPRMLVVGESSYARTLALVFRAVIICPDDLLDELEMPEEGRFPRVFASLERVVLVAGTGDTASDVVRWEEATWRWIEKLSSNGDQHEVSILFVLPNSSAKVKHAALAAGLALDRIDPETSGHGIAFMGDSLETLCNKLSAIRPKDLPPLRALRAGDVRFSALRGLHAANSSHNLVAAASAVADAFAGHEYLLDLFCHPPSHRNGNQLRQWLGRVVTEGVTPGQMNESKSKLADWLRPC